MASQEWADKKKRKRQALNDSFKFFHINFLFTELSAIILEHSCLSCFSEQLNIALHNPEFGIPEAINCGWCRSLPTHVEKILPSEDDPSFIKGKIWNKLQVLVQRDGRFNADIASVESKHECLQFPQLPLSLAGFWAFSQNKIAKEHP